MDSAWAMRAAPVTVALCIGIKALSKLLHWAATYKGATLATPNYGFEKRQKELAKKRKKEDKLKAKSERKSDPLSEDGTPVHGEEVESGSADTATAQVNTQTPAA